MEQKKVIEYTNELTDDFSNDSPYRPWRGLYTYYRRDPFYKLHHFFWCRMLGTPIAWTHAKVRFGWKVINKKLSVLRKKRATLFTVITRKIFLMPPCVKSLLRMMLMSS